VTSVVAWQSAFHNCEFTPALGAVRLTTHPGGFVGLWQELAGRGRFPTRYLVEANETLAQFVARERRSMETHRLHEELLRRCVEVLVVGCGGNGSAIAAGLPYLHSSMLKQGHPYGLHVTVMDGHTVSPFNCVRQPFARREPVSSSLRAERGISLWFVFKAVRIPRGRRLPRKSRHSRESEKPLDGRWAPTFSGGDADSDCHEPRWAAGPHFLSAHTMWGINPKSKIAGWPSPAHNGRRFGAVARAFRIPRCGLHSSRESRPQTPPSRSGA